MLFRFYNQVVSAIKSNLKGSGFSFHELLVVLFVVIALSTAVRFFQLGTPNEYYFDEVYHAMTVKLVARNDPRAYEYIHGDSIEPNTYVEWLHPPLAKYFQALGVLAFGENGFGWRFSGAVFGVLTVLMTGLLAWKLFKNVSVALAALYLISLETLLIAQSRIAMNDIFLVFFMVLTVFLYLHYRERPTVTRLLWAGFAGGLSLATKWSGLFIVLWVIGVELISLMAQWIRQYQQSRRSLSIVTVVLKPLIIRSIVLVALPLVVYVASYWQMFSQGKDLSYFQDLHRQILAYQTSLDATHPYQSTPLQWFLDSKPVWYYVNYSDNERKDIYAIGNPIIFWAGGLSAIGITAYLLWLNGKPKRNIFSAQPVRIAPGHLLEQVKAWTLPQQLLLVTSAYWAVWLPWTLSPRIMFFYHYLPAIPFLAILLAVVLIGLWGLIPDWLPAHNPKWTVARQIFVIAVFSAVTAAFIWLLPQTIALSVPEWWKDSLFLGGLWK